MLASCGGKQKDKLVDTPHSPPVQATADTTVLAVRVNGEGIAYEDFEDEVAIWLGTQSTPPADMETFRLGILEMMIDQRLISQYANANHLVVSDKAVEAEIQTLTDLAQQNEMTLVDVLGLPEAYIPKAVYQMLLLQAVSLDVTQSISTSVSQIHVRHILVKDVTVAQDILQQLDGGANFADLAKQYSIDPATAPLGGDWGWIAPGDLLESEVESILFEMPVPSRWTDPIPTNLGYHIVETLERADERPLDAVRLAQRRDIAFAEWLAVTRQRAKIERYVQSAPTQ
jgi:peptidyl-prolyl cis-trans isomerase C